MATATFQSFQQHPTQRGTSPKVSLPFVRHSLSSMDDRPSLNVIGESNNSRSKSAMSTSEHGKNGIREVRGNLPPLRNDYGERKHQRTPTWPLKQLDTVGREKEPHRKADSTTDTAIVLTGEFEEALRSKLATSVRALRHQFRVHDPSGQGSVSREALQRILFSHIGYIRTDQFNRLLDSLGLAPKSTISYDDFIACFRDNEKVQREWLAPVKRKAFSETTGSIGANIHNKLMKQDLVTASFTAAVIKDKVKRGEFDARGMFPLSCFAHHGRILPPQLREVAGRLGCRMNEEEFLKLWERYDLENTGGIKATYFFKLIGLDSHGNIKPKMPQRQKSMPTDFRNSHPENDQRARSQNMIYPMNEDEDRLDGTHSECDNIHSIEKQETNTLRKVIKKNNQPKPRLENPIDELHYKFEKNYNNMHAAFKHFDIYDDGYVARTDFRAVLREFGFPIAATELEHFIPKCGLRMVKFMISYKDFLHKFMNKSSMGIVNRIVTNTFHVFSRDRLPAPSGDTLSTEELEARLVEFFHKDFLTLLGSFRTLDKYEIGVVTQLEFKNVLERRLGYVLKPEQWERAKQEVGLDPHGLVPYNKFLEKFNITPGAWNKKMEGGFLMKQVSRAKTPPEAMRLREKLREKSELDRKQLVLEMEREQKGEVIHQPAASTKPPTPPNVPKTERLKTPEDRSVDQLYPLIREILRVRFHSMDKAFKKLDRAFSGRMNRAQFHKAIAECGTNLSEVELDRVWSSMKLSPGGVISFREVVRHFSAADNGPPAIKDKTPIEGTKNIIEEMKKVQLERLKENDDIRLFTRENPRPMDETVLLEKTLQKIKPQILINWENLKSLLRTLDTDGESTISMADMRDVLNKLNLGLKEDDITRICAKYDDKKNGRFNYIKFLENYTEHRRSVVVTTETVSTKNTTQPSKIISSNLEKRLLRDWKAIERALRKLDSGRSGNLNVTDFQRILKDFFNIVLREDDAYSILSRFDTNMDGKIAYEKFLAHIVNAAN